MQRHMNHQLMSQLLRKKDLSPYLLLDCCLGLLLIRRGGDVRNGEDGAEKSDNVADFARCDLHSRLRTTSTVEPALPAPLLEGGGPEDGLGVGGAAG